MQSVMILSSLGSGLQPMQMAGAEPVGSVHDSIPLHPEDRHPGFDEFKQKKKPIPHPHQPSERPDGKHPDADHQIDEYA